HLAPDLLGRPTRASAPYGVVAQAVRNLGFREGYILADTSYIAGNLKLRFPESTAADVEYGFSLPAGAPARPALIAWPGPHSEIPAKLKTLWSAFCEETETAGAITRFTAPYEHSRVPYSLNVILQPACRPKVR